MSQHTAPSEFRLSRKQAACKPSPVFGLSRSQLARFAFDRAVASNEAAYRAGIISGADALLKFNALRAAHQKRKEDLQLAAFMGRALGRRE